MGRRVVLGTRLVQLLHAHVQMVEDTTVSVKSVTKPYLPVAVRFLEILRLQKIESWKRKYRLRRACKGERCNRPS